MVLAFFRQRRETKKAGEGNRTPVTSLEGWGSTIELHPQVSGTVPEKKMER